MDGPGDCFQKLKIELPHDPWTYSSTSFKNTADPFRAWFGFPQTLIHDRYPDVHGLLDTPPSLQLRIQQAPQIQLNLEGQRAFPHPKQQVSRSQLVTVLVSIEWAWGNAVFLLGKTQSPWGPWHSTEFFHLCSSVAAGLIFQLPQNATRWTNQRTEGLYDASSMVVAMIVFWGPPWHCKWQHGPSHSWYKMSWR